MQHKKSQLATTGEQSVVKRSFERECRFITNKENKARYAGQWVALDEDQVVAFGEDPVEVIAEAERKGVIDPVLHYFLARDGHSMDWGGWQ